MEKLWLSFACSTKFGKVFEITTVSLFALAFFFSAMKLGSEGCALIWETKYC